MPPKLIKTKRASALSVPERTSGLEGSLLPLKRVLHAGRPSSYALSPTYVKTEKERNKIVEEDRIKAHSEMGILAMQQQIFELERRKDSHLSLPIQKGDSVAKEMFVGEKFSTYDQTLCMSNK